MKYRAESEKTQEESWGKGADPLSCFLCTRNLQMYVGRATVREQREAGVYTSGSHRPGAEFKRVALPRPAGVPCERTAGPAALLASRRWAGARPKPVGCPLYQFSHMPKLKSLQKDRKGQGKEGSEEENVPQLREVWLEIKKQNVLGPNPVHELT